MNVGELLRERDRLLGVIEEAKSARSKLKQINVLIAMYGESENVDLNGETLAPLAFPCPDCERTFATKHGVSMHRVKTHEYAKGRKF
jgi:hypothetical protein